ncbi:type III pantothenate kinase [SAR202 cluster bacterium AD-802-E10_MRT_200m]|nr:type III pantothenate kinase [SAR202 cluster bacterium AD-802-E10_MRT_200m]
MLLTVDIGNTNLNLGAFQGETLKATWRLATDTNKMPDEYNALIQTLLPLKGIQSEEIEAVIMCSVVPPLTTVFEELCKTFFGVKPLVIGPGIKTGVRILYDPPRDVGADRVVDAAAAYRLHGGPVIVVDFGTATVFDAVTRDGDYLGGSLVPGITIAANALYTSASQLRRVELIAPKTAIGRTTAAALQSGLVLGQVSMVEGMVERFRTELGHDAKVIATGGLAPLIAKETDIFHEVNQDLTLIGLRMMYHMNV